MTQAYKQFQFDNYNFDYRTGLLTMCYSLDSKRHYREVIEFTLPPKSQPINRDVVEALCFYTFVIAGSSYYKSFATPKLSLGEYPLDDWQADFFNMIYHGGLSQFVYENKLNPSDLACFEASDNLPGEPVDYNGTGILLLQSGGKDSLLSAELLKQNKHDFTSWHMSTTGKYPTVLDTVGKEVVVTRRRFDINAIREDWQKGGLNGHIPFSALFAGFALIQAALFNKGFVIASNESSADQANVTVNGYAVNHQFTKTFAVERSIEEYMRRYVSADIHYGSLLRPFNELQIAQLFAKYGWPKYKDLYSSCNLANYKQNEDDGKLTWDGTCPKCANTFLLMAPFVDKQELLDLFDGKNLLQESELTQTYKQLLGTSDIKPFECVGTFEELQEAYNLAVNKDRDFENVDLNTKKQHASFDELGPYQSIFYTLIDYRKYI